MKAIALIARIIVGVLFIFSGLIKVNDPVGTAIKLEEYFEVFSTDISSFFLIFIPYALILSVFLSVLEVVLGLAILLWYRSRATIWTLLLMIIFFTFLTFYSAYFNKVTDCGCFGDAIKLTPWQSFIKDIILLVLILVLFFNMNTFRAVLPKRMGNIVVGACSVIGVAVAIYAIQYLPFIDFRAYKIGTNIPISMQPSEPLQYRYIMSKDGKEHTFDSYPTEDGYEYVAMELVNPEAQAKITDYNLWSNEGDFTDESFRGNKLFVVIHNANTASTKNLQAINALVSELGDSVEPWALTASDEASFEAFRHEHQLAMPYFYGDATVLKTMIRTNPGLILMQDGVVKGKWSHNAVPEADEIRTILY
jgi:uncharacterized membrane protein YphA (DoxX/SURF4 family)